MSKRQDEDLIKIVSVERHNYQSDAIKAAELEIIKRNIDIEKIEQVKAALIFRTEEQKRLESKKVSSLKRFIHLIIDFISFLALTLIFAFLLDNFIKTNNQILLITTSNLLFLQGFLSYYIFMEYKFQKTIGKFITKTKVVNINGSKPELGDIVRRTFCRLVPFDMFSFLFTKNGFHDRFSDTTCIKNDN